MADSRPHTRRSQRWSTADWVALVAVTAGAGLLRLHRLTRPELQIFDERTYVKDACYYVAAAGRPPCFDREITTVHPPLGKWLIGWGIEAGDFAPLGWRIAAALAGTLTVALVYLLARRLLDSTLGAVVAAGLVAVDFLHLVMSRIGMLDIFVGAFGVAAFLFVVFDRDRIVEAGRAGSVRWWSRGGWRPWRIAAGVAAGLAAATKWAGLLVFVGVVVLTIAWEASARRKAAGGSRREAFNRAVSEEWGSVLVGLVLGAFVAYCATFIGRLEGSFLAWPWAEGSFYRALWDRQFYMYEFHRYLVTPNWAGSPAWSWPLVMRPIPYFLERLPGDQVRYVFGGGNPFVWWASILALAFVGVQWWRKRDANGPLGVIVAGFFLGYLPWFVLAYKRSAIFIYYMVPLVPFMCLALGYAAVRMWRRTAGRAVVTAFALAALGSLALAYPLLTAQPIAESAWHARMWVYDDCEQSYADPAVTDGAEGEPAPASTVTNGEAHALAAWCGL
jgi:dolichyl-phosphate-mannose--protein O-mannosyl transferase